MLEIWTNAQVFQSVLPLWEKKKKVHQNWTSIWNKVPNLSSMEKKKASMMADQYMFLPLPVSVYAHFLSPCFLRVRVRQLNPQCYSPFCHMVCLKHCVGNYSGGPLLPSTMSSTHCSDWLLGCWAGFHTCMECLQAGKRGCELLKGEEDDKFP